MRKLWRATLCAMLCPLLAACASSMTQRPGDDDASSPPIPRQPELSQVSRSHTDEKHPSDDMTPPPTEPNATEEPDPTPAISYFAQDVERASHPRVRIEKANRLLLLYDGEELIARMRIGLGQSPEGDKTQEGDSRTPEGEYYACSRNDQSRYYLSIGVSYPSIKDAQRALEEGRIDEDTYDDIEGAIEHGRRPPWDTPLGGEIMIHGRGSARDWTAGCIAVEDEDMDVLWKHVRVSTPIEIVP